jgi:hypothetical protein
MVTGAERPGMEIPPSSWGRESLMVWRSQWRVVTKPMIAKRMTRVVRMTTMRRKMRRRLAWRAASSEVRGWSGMTSGEVRWGRSIA